MLQVDIKDLKLIRAYEKYPRGANSPTIIKKYKCPCGRGKIIEQNTIGFNDHFVTLNCRRCLKTYQPFVDICGDSFELSSKDE